MQTQSRYVRAEAGLRDRTTVVYYDEQGRRTVYSGGSWAWRNHNPGNLRFGDFARRHGAIGSAGGFAVFPDLATGRAALAALLRGPTYAPLSIYAAIERYAPPSENQTDQYRELVAELTGLAVDRILSSLSADEFERVLDAIQRIEGYVVGQVTVKRKVIGTRRVRGGALLEFKIEGYPSYVDLGTALHLAGSGELDAVIARSRNGKLYLRSVPDRRTDNNFPALAGA